MATLISVLPCGVLTDDIFVFNQDNFRQILDLQSKDLGFLASPPVRALVGVAGIVGGTATGIVGGVGGVASNVVGGLFGAVAQAAPIGGGLIGGLGRTATGTIGLAEKTAGILVDPTRVIRDHINYSNAVRDNLPGALKQLDDTIHAFASELGNNIHLVWQNPGQGNTIISSLQDRVTLVLSALANLNYVLTQNNLLENIKVGQDKYKGIQLPSTSQIFLGPIADLLPKVLASVATVRVAFETLSANLKAVKVKINSGVTDPKLIFVESSNEIVEDGWRHFEVQRKTMTYLPYHY